MSGDPHFKGATPETLSRALLRPVKPRKQIVPRAEPAVQLEMSLIHHEVRDSVIDQRAIDGYVNATAMCKVAGKQFHDYARLGSTQAFLSALTTDTGIPLTEVESTTGAVAVGRGE